MVRRKISKKKIPKQHLRSKAKYKNPSKFYFLKSFRFWLLVLGISAFMALSWKFLSIKNSVDNSTAHNLVTTSPTSESTPVGVPDSQRGLVEIGGGWGITGVQYYDVGTIQSGKYQGYHKILADVSDGGQAGGFMALFATKDDKTYILDSLNGNTNSSNGSDPYFGINKAKIQKIDNISGFPSVIKLDNNFSLYRLNLQHVTNLSSYTKLDSLNTGFNLYEQDQNYDLFYGTLNSSADNRLLDKYLKTTGDILATDNQGLEFTYYLTSNAKITKASQDIINQGYGAGTVLSFEFNKNQIQTNLKLYDNYNSAFSSPCSETPSVMENIPDSALETVGSMNGTGIFMIKDKTHPTYKLTYDLRTQFSFNINGSETYYDKLTDNPNVPTLGEYIATNPLLFVKDPWGRLLGLAEDHYLTGLGCAKPVLYFYPPKTMKISVKFTNPMDLNISIPQYNNGWYFTANPNGTLADLQPKYTDCTSLRSDLFGLEYAKNACNANSYPYLYWSGKNIVNPYPAINGGWIVPAIDLKNFVFSKLSEVGLNNTEKSDMISYWIPEMLSKKAPFYRISFLQSDDMNSFIPMNINPKPDTFFRIFLDWIPLESKSNIDIPPQILNRILRSGFTVVEWGGLQR